MYGSNFIKQHSETIVVCNKQNSDCSLKNRLIVSFIIISAHFRSYRPRCLHGHAFVTGRLCLSLRSNQIKFRLYYGFIHRISIFVYFGLLYRVGKKVRQQTHDHNCVKS